jgi:hypothetical protein
MSKESSVQVQSFKWMKVPHNLLVFQKQLGINDTELRFVLGVLMCESLRIASTPKNMKMPKPTVSSVKRKMIAKKLMEVPAGKFNPYNDYYDLTPLWKTLERLSLSEAMVPEPDNQTCIKKIPDPPPVFEIPEPPEEVIETSEQFVARQRKQMEECDRIRNRGANHALPKAEVGIEANAEPG